MLTLSGVSAALYFAIRAAFSREVGRIEPQAASSFAETSASPSARSCRAVVTETSRRGTVPEATASSSALAEAGRAASVLIASSRSSSPSDR